MHDISEDELLATVGDILATQSTKAGQLPCTLIVLDELQQFINDDPTVILAVQQIVEACSSRFGSSVLFVATGQSALQANAVLARFQDRFTVRVHLTDTDIEKVVRSVVLQKRPDKEAELRDVLEKVSGEIDRHLPGNDDRSVGCRRGRPRPRLPGASLRAGASGSSCSRPSTREAEGFSARSCARRTRRSARSRTSRSGTSSALTSSSRTRKLGCCRPVSCSARWIRTSAGSMTAPTTGRLLSRLCATIFLISRLPRETGADAGIRATADTLADLVVTDLPAGSAELRRRVPELLDALVEQGKLQKVEDEYRLQTREGQEWEGEFRRRETAIRGDAGTDSPASAAISCARRSSGRRGR